jgi:hypothetical protein
VNTRKRLSAFAALLEIHTVLARQRCCRVEAPEDLDAKGTLGGIG